ncbi:U-box domain-containing protein 24-like [Phragmites australis]|uniref:U-box domain-containing protein 24-like n=1 Tax=Phragmites australis TaxID=29695 RepID=UPI002D7A3B95|nr:U-box domain-containing protein 24-like [Phragmites australis]XP_062220876.1 U-box domain-containing protein 24-like [Phragmites australis]
MAHDFGGDSEFEDQSNEGYQEPAFEAFMCPLTRQVMHDPVTIETGQTFEREAILKWFKECRDSGRKPTCPLTQTELRSTDISPSIALRNVIDEWRARNEEKELEKACNSLNLQSEDDTLHALVYISQMCQKSSAKKNLVRKEGIIPTIADMLKSNSRRVRLKSLEVLRVVVEDNNENKEELGEGDTIRTIIKFLSNEHFQERELAVSLLYELSKYEPICERIGAVYGAILLLVGMGSSKSENVISVEKAAVEKAENTLKNLEKYETNVKQMAENGRLQPLLTKLLEGTPEVQVAMAEYLGELALANDMKVVVAEQVGALLVSTMKTGTLPAREATLKALREISSNECSAKILLEAGILPPLVKDLFSVGAGHLPMRLKEVSAAILANLVASGANFRSIPLDESGQTLLSEDVVHSLLHLISNTGPAIECKLLNVLVGLTGSPTTVTDVVSAIRSSGATISLIQYVEAAHREIRVESLKLLRNVSPYMGAELADALGGSSGHLSSLLRVVSDDRSGVWEEQAAAVGLLGDLPERDWNLTRQLLDLGAFRTLASKLVELRRGTIRGNRHVAPFTEGAVKVLYRVTCALQEEAEYVELAREVGLAPLFVELLQQMSSGLDAVQVYSAMALENLSMRSSSLTTVPDAPPPPPGFMCACFGGGGKANNPKPGALGTCRVHGGFCSLRETFCLVETGCKAVERLVACLEHADARVVEAALAALSTLVGDDVANVTEGVVVMGEAEGLRPVVEVLVENRTEALQRRAVWAVERILRVEDIAQEVAVDQSVASALVEAYRNGDARTRQTAERALRHLDRIPNFSSAFHHAAAKPPATTAKNR